MIFLYTVLIWKPIWYIYENYSLNWEKLISCWKMSSVNFLKKHIQYLGHIVSGKGITPMPEKLECICNMPPPKTPKEVKQFLGLIGYYHKFVPRFSDLARPLNALTRKGVTFEWTPICHESFEMLKTSLMTEPIWLILTLTFLMCYLLLPAYMPGHVF